MDLNEAGDNPVGLARMIVHGHYHHFTAVTQGGRTIMGVPAMSPSTDFQTRTGYSTSTGVVTMTVTKDGWDNLKILINALYHNLRLCVVFFKKSLKLKLQM